MVLLKFRKLDDFYQIREIVDEGLTFFSPLDKLNDKDETFLSANLAIDTWPILSDIPNFDKPVPYILSLSSGYIDIENKNRMWDEYGEICIFFQYDETASNRLHLSQVSYLPANEYQKLLSSNELEVVGGNIKSARWSHEEEYRLISTTPGYIEKNHHHHHLAGIGLTILKIEYHQKAVNHITFKDLTHLCMKNKIPFIQVND